MQLLLDTHVVLWAVTAWELATNYRLGKVPNAETLVLGYPGHLARLEAREVVVSSSHAVVAGLLEWTHRDPWDRMIAAQAMSENLTLVTADHAFADLAGVHVLW